MARKNESPQKAAMREMMCSYLKNNNISIKKETDVNSVMHNMMSVLLEGALDEELGYSKYDYRNKDTDWKKSMQWYSWIPSITMSAVKDVL